TPSCADGAPRFVRDRSLVARCPARSSPIRLFPPGLSGSSVPLAVPASGFSLEVPASRFPLGARRAWDDTPRCFGARATCARAEAVPGATNKKGPRGERSPSCPLRLLGWGGLLHQGRPRLRAPGSPPDRGFQLDDVLIRQKRRSAPAAGHLVG